MTGANAPGPIVLTSAPELLDQILAVTAAAGVDPLVVSDSGSVRPVWTAAPMIIVGVDQAKVLAGMVLPRRAGVYVVADDQDQDEACTWSVALGAAVVSLPGGASWLTQAVADLSGPGLGDGVLLTVVPGSGGAGASTLAAGLAFVAAQRRLKPLLLDADPLGGGLDLLVGAERAEGWRWPRLATAQGHIGELKGQLPLVDGFDLLSMARGSDLEPYWGAEPMKAVLASALRSYDLTVADLPRELSPPVREVLRRSTSTLLVVSATLRGVAAAQRMRVQLGEACTDLQLVVRRPRSGGIEPALVADGLDLPCLASVVEDPRLKICVERGEPPGRSARSQLASSCRQILAAVVGEGRRVA